MLELSSSPRVITFDCYGTLCQWHRAVEESCRTILAAHLGNTAPSKTPALLAGRIRELAVQQQQGLFRPYREVLQSSLEQGAKDFGLVADENDLGTLFQALGCIEPHPEVPAVLRRLRECYRLAIISNTDDTLIARTVEALGVPIDHVITAQQACAYKPDHQLFLYAYKTMGVGVEETVHVGMGQFTDLKVCNELGIRHIWINRNNEKIEGHWHPDAELGDLSGLPGLLEIF